MVKTKEMPGHEGLAKMREQVVADIMGMVPDETARAHLIERFDYLIEQLRGHEARHGEVVAQLATSEARIARHRDRLNSEKGKHAVERATLRKQIRKDLRRELPPQ